MVPPRVPNPPARFAVSLIDPPTRAVGVATVVRVGVAWLTTLVSPGSLQAVASAALSADLLSHPFLRCGPARLGVNGSEVAFPGPPPGLTSAFVLVTFVALPLVPSFGPESREVLALPTRRSSDLRFAVSLIDPPTRAVGVATVVRVGVAWLTTLVSPGSLHAV